MSKLFIIEDLIEYNYLVNSMEITKNDYIASMNPDIFYKCSKKNLNFISFEDFFERKKFVNNRPEICKLNNKWINELDRYFLKNIPDFTETGFTPARFSILGLYGLLDELSFAYNSLSNVLKEYDFEYVFIPTHTGYEFATWSRIFPRSSIFPACAEEITRELNISIKFFNVKKSITQKSKNKNIYTFILSFFNANLKRLVKLTRKYGLTFFFKFVFLRLFSSKKVIFIGAAYDLMRLIKIFVDKNYNIEFSEFPERDYVDVNISRDIKTKLAQTIPNLYKETSLEYPFENPAFKIPKTVKEEIIKRYLLDIIPVLWGAFVKFKNKRLSDYSMVFFWAFGEGVHPALSFAADGEVKTALYQHGGGSRNIWLTDYYQEATLVNYYFSYGDGINKTLKQVHTLMNDESEKLSECKTIGAIRISEIENLIDKSNILSIRKLIQKKLNTSKLVLYVPNVYHYQSCYLTDSILHGIEYFKFQQKIVNFFKEQNDIGLIYKGFETDLDLVNGSPIKDYINDKDISNILYTSNIPLSKLIFAVDKIVVDHNQTALNEILQSKKETLLFDQGEYNIWNIGSDAKELLSQNIHLAETQIEFFDMLDLFIKDEIPKKTINFESKYFSEYCHIERNPKKFDDQIFNKISKIIQDGK